MESGRVNGTDDVIATLSSRVSELSKRVAVLQAELEASQKRVAIYEEHDSTIQDALSGALRAAYTIRERAETTAAQILEQAREERRLLLKEIERLRDERDSLQEEIAAHRRSGIAAVAPRPLSTDAAAAELRAVASEALRGLFQEIVDGIRATPRPTAPPAGAVPAAPVPPAAPPQAYSPAPASSPESPAPPPAMTAQTPSAPPAERPTYEYMSKIKRAPLADESEEEEVAPQAQTSSPAPAAPAPVPQSAPPAPVPERAAPPPLEVVPRSADADEIARPRVEAAVATSDILLVLSPVASFPRLVEVERHIQALPVVRTLYVRDFRGGTATLAVALRSAMTPEEFAGMLSGLEQPRLRLVSGSRNTIELRVEGEAGVA